MYSTTPLPYFILEEIIHLLPLDYLYELLYIDRLHNLIISQFIFQRLTPSQTIACGDFASLLKKYGKACRELEIPPQIDAAWDSLPAELKATPKLTTLRLHAKDAKIISTILSGFGSKLAKLHLAHLSSQVHLSCIGGLASRLTELFVYFGEDGNFAQLFEIESPSLVKLTANVPSDDLILANGIDRHFTSLRELHLFKRFRGSNHSLLWVNYKTRKVRAVGTFDKDSGILFSYLLDEKFNKAHIDPNTAVLFIHSIMNALFSQVIFRQKRWIDPQVKAFYFNSKTVEDGCLLFRKDGVKCIVFEVEDASGLLLPEKDHAASILRFRGLKVIPDNLLGWIFRCFPRLRVLELEEPIPKESWCGTFNRLRYFISSNASLATLTSLIASAPKLKVICSNLVPSQLASLKEIGPNILFRPYSKAAQEADPFRFDDSLISMMN